jgi:hypothetical protein
LGHGRGLAASSSVADVAFWHIAKFFCNAKLGRYRSKADIEQAAFHSIWLKLPTTLEGGEVKLNFSSPAPDAAQQECCEPGSTLLCMGLFSRFFVQACRALPKGRNAGSEIVSASRLRDESIHLQHIML